MLALPLPLFIAEIVIFYACVQHWGFWNSVGLYLLPCLLGALIVSTIGRVAMMTLQGTVMRGQLPANRLLHSAAIFISGLLFLVPSFFTRVFAVILFLPGLRHFVLWRFKLTMAQKIAQGGVRVFNFGNFGGGGFAGGFSRGGPFEPPGGGGFPQERDVTNNNQQIDVTPLEVTHVVKKDQE